MPTDGRHGPARRTHVLVRTYRRDDWGAVVDVYVTARVDERRTIHAAPAQSPQREVSGLRGVLDGSVLVAERAGRMVGFAAWTGHQLGWLYVHPQSHRCGVGTALVEAIAVRSPVLEAMVLEENRRAVAFFLTLGFVVFGHQTAAVGRPGDASAGVFLMRRVAAEMVAGR